MFANGNEEGYQQVLEGIRRKTLVYGEETLMVEFLLNEGAALPLHSHPHEQTGYLVKGRMRLTIGGKTRELRAGDSWCVAKWVEHGAEVVEDSVAVEVFSPVREDYLP